MLTHAMTVYRDNQVVFEGTGTVSSISFLFPYVDKKLIDQLPLHSTIEHDSGMDTITHITRFALSAEDLTNDRN